MKVLYVPGRQQGKSNAFRLLANAHLQAGHVLVVELGGRSYPVPHNYWIVFATSEAVTLRTPEGMLVTYKPKRKP